MDKTIIDGNKLIAEFMGVSHAAVDGNLYYYVNGDSYDTLEYHTSWDWLMPVVEKIYKLMNAITEIETNTTWAVLVSRLEESILRFKIADVFLVTVEAIKWYNNQSQSKTNNNEK